MLLHKLASGERRAVKLMKSVTENLDLLGRYEGR